MAAYEVREDLAAAIDASSKEFFAKSYKPSEYDTPEDIEWETQLFSDREYAFAQKVLGGVALMAQRRSSGLIVATFDVDESIAKTKFDENGDNAYTVARPALPHVLSTLREEHGERIKVGLLTSRGQEHIDAEVAAPTYTTSAGTLLDPDFALSSRDGTYIRVEDDEEYERIQGLMHYGTHDDWYDKLEPIIDQEIIARDKEVYWNWYDPKLIVLQGLIKAHPDYGFVHVDDLPFVNSIRPNHPQLQGVHIDETAYFNGGQ